MKERKQRPIPPDEYEKKSFSQWIRDRHYQDYRFYTIPEVKGKRLKNKTVAVYEGQYYRANVSDSRLRSQKLLYWFLYFGGLGLFILCGIQPVKSNAASYVGAAEALALLLMLYLGVVLIMYSTAEREMTAQVYRSIARRTAQLGTGSGAAMALCSVLTALHGLLNGSLGQSFTLIIGFLAAGAALWAVNWLEDALPYTIRQSTDQPPEGADRWETGR